MAEWGLFNDEAERYTEDDAVEAGFESKEAAEKAIAERYQPDDGLEAHLIEWLETCDACHGNGWVEDEEDGGTMTCEQCDGEGYV
jgi:hypothetical protein